MLSDVLDGEADRNSLHFVLYPTPHGDGGALEALLLTLHTSCILFFYYEGRGRVKRNKRKLTQLLHYTLTCSDSVLKHGPEVQKVLYSL